MASNYNNLSIKQKNQLNDYCTFNGLNVEKYLSSPNVNVLQNYSSLKSSDKIDTKVKSYKLSKQMYDYMSHLNSITSTY